MNHFFNLIGIHRFYVYPVFISLLCLIEANAQTFEKSNNEVIKAWVIDENKLPLPYANINVLNKNKGVISNEEGCFTLNISELNKTDTLRISYIGYKSIDLTLEALKISPIISLREENLILNNITVFANTPDPQEIVKKILSSKEQNYPKTTSKKQVFIRKRYSTNINKVNFNCKKSNISNLNEELMEVLEKELPKHSISYTDFLGDILILNNQKDSSKLKIAPIKMIKLQDQRDFTKLEELQKTFEKVLKDTNEKEYWKIKTGIIGSKIHVDENDITVGNKVEKTDSLSNKNTQALQQQKRSIKIIHKYSSFEDEDTWEFLYKTNKYQYTLHGRTMANGEEVYIIDFKPKNQGLFVGRMYIAINTYALVRVDFKYDTGKTGRDIQLLGMGYTENKFITSLYYEKKGTQYRLKYYSRQKGFESSVDRIFSLLKKKTRFIFDRTISQVKVAIDIAVTEQSSVELLVLEDNEINQNQFTDFIEKNEFEIIYVDQFDEKLWEDYPIIEPTKKMKEYKKLN